MVENSVPSQDNEPPPSLPPLTAFRRSLAQVNFWKAYLAILFAGMAGMVATRSAVFPQLMFLATVVYLGGRLIGFGEQTRRAAPSAQLVGIFDRLRSLPFSISLITFAAFGLMAFSAYLFVPGSDLWANVDLAALVMVVGGGLVGIAVLINRRQQRVEEPLFAYAEETPAFPQPYSLVAVVGIFMLLLEAEISGQSLGLSLLQNVSYTIQGILFWGGLALLAIGMSGSTGRGWLSGLIRRLRSGDRTLLALIAIVVIAFVLRAWNLNVLKQSMDDGMSFPPVFPFLSDNPETGLVAIASQYPQVYSQFMAISLRVVGFTLAGVHGQNVVIGTLMIIAAFMIGETLFDRKMGLVAALILATFPPHLHLSRITFIGLGDAMMGAFLMAFLFRALKFNRRADWVLAGIFFGLTQYFYEAGRLFFPIFIPLCLGYLALTNFKKLRSMMQGWSLFFVCALIVAIPVYYAMLARGGPFFTRMGDSGTGIQYWTTLLQSGDVQEIIRRLAYPYLGLVHFPETILYYAGTHPMVLEYVVPFLLLGVAYLIWTWRKPSFIVLMWLLAVPTANLIMVDPVENPRYIIGYTAMALTIAAGICYGLPLLFSALRNRTVALGATVVVAAVIGAAQVNYYFNEHLPALIQQIRTETPFPDVVDAALRMTDLPGGTEVYFISTIPADSSVATTFIGVFRWDHLLPYVTITDIAPKEVTPEWLKSLPLDKDYAFFVEPGHDDVVDTLKANFVLDDPQYTTQTDMPPGKAFVAYVAPLAKQPHPAPASSS